MENKAGAIGLQRKYKKVYIACYMAQTVGFWDSDWAKCDQYIRRGASLAHNSAVLRRSSDAPFLKRGRIVGQGRLQKRADVAGEGHEAYEA